MFALDAVFEEVVDLDFLVDVVDLVDSRVLRVRDVMRRKTYWWLWSGT